MTKAKAVNGKDLMLFVEVDSKLKTVALATSCKLSLSGETLDTASKDSGKWTEKIMKKLSWSASSDNNFSADDSINGYDALFALWVAMKPIKIQVGIPQNADSDELPDGGWNSPAKAYEGEALITGMELNAPDGDKATFSVTLEGTGALKPSTAVQAASTQSTDKSAPVGK